MALIAGFPDFGASAKPSPADLNAAVDKIIEQIGGVKTDGTMCAGNLEAANHVAGIGFRNSQKKEPRAIFPLSFRTIGPEAGAAAWVAKTIGPLPFDMTIAGASMACDGATVIDKAGLIIYRNDVELTKITADATLSWPLNLDVYAGDILRVEKDSVTYISGGPAVEIRVILWCKALHRR